jgi:hypothetical protein
MAELASLQQHFHILVIKQPKNHAIILNEGNKCDALFFISRTTILFAQWPALHKSTRKNLHI